MKRGIFYSLFLLFLACHPEPPVLKFVETEASWSPDGSTIAYAHNLEYEGDTGGIWFINSDGTNARSFFEGMQVDWSPDGEWVAFVRPFAPVGLFWKSTENDEIGGVAHVGGLES